MAALPGAPLLCVKRVTLRFGGLAALEDVELQVVEGEIHALIGPNGAGKTSLLNVVTALYQPDAGEVTFAGEGLVGLRAHEVVRRGIARTFQHGELFNGLSVLDNVVAGAYSRGRAGLLGAALRLPAVAAEERRLRRRAEELLDLVGLWKFRNAPPASLPAALARLLGLARALAAEPRMILLDELAAGMNSQEKGAVRDLVRRLRDELALTVLLIEHDVGLVMALADRVTVLDHGRRIAAGTPGQVQADSAVIEAYLGRSAARASS